MNLKLYIIIIIIIMVIIIRKMWLHAHSRPHRFHVAVAGPLHLAIFGRLWEERDKLLEMLNDFLYFLSLSLYFFLFYITVIFYTLSLSLSPPYRFPPRTPHVQWVKGWGRLYSYLPRGHCQPSPPTHPAPPDCPTPTPCPCHLWEVVIKVGDYR